MAFDKAKCEQCPLKKHWQKKKCWSPVDFEQRASGDGGVLILGEGPTKTDMSLGRPFSDMYGADLLDALKTLGLRREDVSWGHVIGCRWPDDDPKTYIAKLRALNRRRAKKWGKGPLLSPVEACRQHTEHHMQKSEAILSLGSLATKAFFGNNVKLDGVRGAPSFVGKTKVIPSYTPQVVRKNPRFRDVFLRDLAKMLRHYNDELQWKDPEVIYNPTYEVAKEFFASVKEQGDILVYDVETDGIDALSTDLRCVGIGTKDRALVIGFVSIDGVSRFYSKEDEAQMKDLLREVFTDETFLKGGHNAGYFDRLVIEQHLGVTPRPLVDSILLHKLAASEHRHNLGFIGSYELDLPAWKADHTGVEAKTDEELHAYCATDVAVTGRIMLPVRHQAEMRQQLHLYSFDEKIQNICAGMRRMGMRIDEGRRLAHEQEQAELVARHRKVMEKMHPEVHPNSTAQLRELLFIEWGLPPSSFTPTGEISVNADALRTLATSPLLSDKQRKYVTSLRFYRRGEKLLSTYLRKLAPGAGLVRDGYVYPNWNSHGTVTGRLSSSGPNFQNIPHALRDMFIPPEGCVFVGADYDQLELRYCSGLAGAAHYLDAFEKQLIDPHNLTGDLMFGEKFWQVEGAPETKMGKGTGQFKRMRNLAKAICFASLYGASAPKIHELVTSTEDNDGNLIYAHYTLQQIRVLHRRWKRQAPEFARWWAKTLRSCKENGYVAEIVLGRRRYFHKEDYNAVLNFPVQAGAFNVVALSMIDLVENHLPFDFKNKIGLVNQLHDAVLFSVPVAQAEDVKQLVTETLTRRVDGLPVTFTAEAEIAESWREA